MNRRRKPVSRGEDFFGSHPLSTILSRSQLRAKEIESLYPSVEFFRVDGEILGFGIIPERACGTIDGNPFKYYFRYDAGNLCVWDKSKVSLEQAFEISSLERKIDPMLVSEVHYTLSEDSKHPYVPDEEEAMQTLFATLETPSDEWMFGSQLKKFAQDNGLWTTVDFRKSLENWNHGFTVVERGDSFMDSTEIILRSDSGAAVRVSWKLDEGNGHDRGFPQLTVHIIPPSENPALTDAVSYEEFTLEEHASVNDAVGAFFEYFAEAMWHSCYFESYDNLIYTDLSLDADRYSRFVDENQKFVEMIEECLTKASRKL